MFCSSCICLAMAALVSAIFFLRDSSAFCLASYSSNFIRDLRSQFKRVMQSSCCYLRKLSYSAFNLACLASSCLLIRIDCWIFIFSMFRSLRNYSILFLFCWAIMASYCIFSIFAWTFSLFLCLSLKTSEALFLVSSIFFQVFTSSCFRRAIRFANSQASLSTLFKEETFYAFHNHSH